MGRSNRNRLVLCAGHYSYRTVKNYSKFSVNIITTSYEKHTYNGVLLVSSVLHGGEKENNTRG
jgi:hypothetical protein